ncbi:MAG: type 4a pilus biogenesis protein PilO [Candidatus Omnitrophica bacterium]|nr:type 4a pilus biogenesis protein PilO [Candidatus Omnitrophota bacterium]
MRFNFKKINNLFFAFDRKKLIQIISVVVIFLIFDFYFILSSQIRTNRTLSQKINKLKKDLKSFKKEFSLMQEGLKIKITSGPRMIQEQELSWLMEEIYNLAAKNKIEISQLKPQKETKTSLPAIDIIAYLLHLNLNSDYHSLINFIQGIEEHQILMGIEELEIIQNPRDTLRQNINLIIRLYVKK